MILGVLKFKSLCVSFFPGFNIKTETQNRTHAHEISEFSNQSFHWLMVDVTGISVHPPDYMIRFFEISGGSLRT